MGFALEELHQLEAALSDDMAISSAIWQALLVSDSLGNSACAKGGHWHNFKHQTCCPGYQRRSNTDELMKSSFSYHRNRLLCTRRICHLVNGSLVTVQPSPVVPTKVVPHASPAISDTGPPVTSDARCNPANNIYNYLPHRSRIWRIFQHVQIFQDETEQLCTKHQKRDLIGHIL